MLKKVLLLLVTLAPLNSLRIVLLRLFFNYDISFDSKIGMFNVIECGTCRIRGGRIGRFNQIQCNEFVMEVGSVVSRFNRFLNINKVNLCTNSNIVSRNSFIGTRQGTSPFKEFENVSIGKDSIITRKHYFDISDEIQIGEDVTFGGFGSQVWTHGFDNYHVKIQAPVFIDNNSYLGSSCVILPGVKIGQMISIASGATVSKTVLDSGFYTSSNLIRKCNVPDFRNDCRKITYCGNEYIRKDRNTVCANSI